MHGTGEVMEWTYLMEGRGIAGTHECNGWKVWSAGSGWKITRPDGYTYEREYKHLAGAKKCAEGKMKKNDEGH